MTESNSITQPQHRGLFHYLLDRIVAWLFGFPSERCSYSAQAVRIPISTGLSRIELAADLFQPIFSNGSEPLGTVLVRCPYGRGPLMKSGVCAYAARGYQVLLVSSRGTFGSGGDFDAFRTEVEDGRGVVKWMRQQTWYTGTFVTVGGSYLGYTQWALLVDPPKDLVAVVSVVGPHDFSRPSWDTGALDLDIIKWADKMSYQEESMFTWKALTRPKLDPVLESIPLAQNFKNHIGEGSPWVHNIIAKSNLSDPHYAPMQLASALDRVNIPILIVTGWYDLFLDQSMEQYFRLKERGCNVALTVGPWAHFKSIMASQVHRQGLDWIDEHLGGRSEAKRTSTVQYFVTGIKEWRSVSVYPPSTTPLTFHLQVGGKLGTDTSSNMSGFSTFTFDPQSPTPTIGGNSLLSDGSVDDSALAKRSDVLVFNTAPLEKNLEFCGQPVIHLNHSTNNPFADVFVRVSEVNAKGKSCNTTETYRRLDPKRKYGTELKLLLNHCSHRFLKGKRIRVMVAGGNFPHFARNQGVENVGHRESEMRAVEHTVHFGGLQGSKVVFPVVAI